MAGRTPHEAVREFVRPLQLALSCVTSEVLRAGGYHVADEPHALTLERGLPVRLRGEGRLSLTLDHHFRIVEDPGARGPYKCSTTSYLYGLDDPDGREVLSYQWHPGGRSPVTWPHLHLGAAAEVGRSELARAHLPTGRVSIEELLRLAITELGVEPLRDDWREVLERTQGAYETWRTWP